MNFDAARAKKVDLILLPSHVDGKSCKTCHNFDEKTEYCDHKEVMMTVHEHMACKEWNRPDTKPVTEDIDEDKEELKSRFELWKEKVKAFSD